MKTDAELLVCLNPFHGFRQWAVSQRQTPVVFTTNMCMDRNCRVFPILVLDLAELDE